MGTFGTGLGHYVPLVVYLGFWVMSIVSLVKSPLLGFYYMLPFIPYRSLRDHFLDYPLGANMLTILVLAVLVGALLRGKRLPKSKMYAIWMISAVYLYFSMWLGVVLKGVPAPIWMSDANFATWREYMIIPLVFIVAGLVIEDRKSIRTTILIAAIALVLIDRSCILESMSRTWTSFDENKRDFGALTYGPNETAAFLAQSCMFFWGFTVFMKRLRWKVLGYLLVAATLFATLYLFSRAAYLAVLFSVLLLAVLKDRKILLLLGAFMLTWQTVVPTPVRERVQMTNQGGQLDYSAQQRVDLWEESKRDFLNHPILGQGFATFQYGEHVGELKDTHNWFVKVVVETGLVGFALTLFLLQQMIASSFRLFRRATDPLYKGLGFGLFLMGWAFIVANLFGDRWSYLEGVGVLWVLCAAGTRALELTSVEQTAPAVLAVDPVAIRDPYRAYQ